jgi:hypothetical protein
LDNAIHSFRQDIHDHDQRIDTIVQDLQADCINPDSFVSTQNLASRVQASITDMVDPLHAALLAKMETMQRSYDAMLSKYRLMIERGHALGMEHEQRFDIHETLLNESSAKQATLQGTLATLSTSLDVNLAEVATTTASVVSRVAKVASTVNFVDTKLDWLITMGDSLDDKLMTLTTQLTQVANSSMVLDQRLQTLAGNISTRNSLLDSTHLSMAASRMDTTRKGPFPVTPF